MRMREARESTFGILDGRGLDDSGVNTHAWRCAVMRSLYALGRTCVLLAGTLTAAISTAWVGPDEPK
jgi:hypothetical protein